MEEVGVFRMFVDFFIPCFEVTLVRYFMGFLNFLSLVHDEFMWMLYEIFHAMFESKKYRFYWCIHVSTEAHGDILNIIVSLDSAVHESTKPVVEWSSMWFLNFFQLLSYERCSHEEFLFKRYIHWKLWFLGFNFIFCLCSPIFLNSIFMM